MPKRILVSTSWGENGEQTTLPFTVNLGTIDGVSGYSRLMVRVLSVYAAVVNPSTINWDNVHMRIQTNLPTNNTGITGVLNSRVYPLTPIGTAQNTFGLSIPTPWFEIKASSFAINFFSDDTTQVIISDRAGSILLEVKAFK
jgi:hypothetical protein